MGKTSPHQRIMEITRSVKPITISNFQLNAASGLKYVQKEIPPMAQAPTSRCSDFRHGSSTKGLQTTASLFIMAQHTCSCQYIMSLLSPTEKKFTSDSTKHSVLRHGSSTKIFWAIMTSGTKYTVKVHL